MKIENDDLWKEIKSGNLRGLSIEGYFIDKLEKMNKTYTDEEIQTAYKELQAEGKIQKVEFTIVAEAKQLVNDFYSMLDKDRSHELINEGLGLMKKHAGNVMSFQKKLEIVYKEADEAIKKLGINRNTFQVLDDLDEIRTKSKEEFKRFDTRIKKIQSIK